MPVYHSVLITFFWTSIDSTFKFHVMMLPSAAVKHVLGSAYTVAVPLAILATKSDIWRVTRAVSSLVDIIIQHCQHILSDLQERGNHSEQEIPDDCRANTEGARPRGTIVSLVFAYAV